MSVCRHPKSRSRLVVKCAAAVLALLVTSAPATAAPKRITGKLSKPGYTVVALAASGEAAVARAIPKFRLRPPAKRVTLHLRAPDGVYAGPIVIGTRRGGKRAIVGVKAGAKLGEIKVNKRKGYAKLTQAPRGKQIDEKRTARAKKGVPIGARTFGLVRAKVRSGSPADDRDADGVPDPLDIDDNGNRVLDRYERRVGARATGSTGGDPTATASGLQLVDALVLAVNDDGSVRGRICNGDFEATTTWPAGSPTPVVGEAYSLEIDFVDAENITVLSVSGPIAGGCPPPIPSVAPGLMLTLKDTVNANASTLTRADINQTLAQRGFLFMQGPPLGGTGVELDCAPNPDNPGGRTSGLAYCTPGGTGRVLPSPLGGTSPRSFPLAFPDCCDGDGDGFGSLGPLELDEDPGGINAFFSHGATTDQIGTGDILTWRVSRGGEERKFPRTLADVFAAVPALVSYRDGAGNSGSVSYPVPPPYVGSRPDYLGPFEGPYQGFPVAPCPAGAPPPCEEGDVVLTLEFWRPQREAIAGVEQGEWTDIGGLVYAPGFSGPWSGSDPGQQGRRGLPSLPACARGDVSTTDPQLTPEEVVGPFNRGFGFRDSATDRPASRANSLSFSVNVTDCLASTTTIPNVGGSWESGENVSMWLQGSLGEGAADGNAAATQQLLFTLE